MKTTNQKLMQKIDFIFDDKRKFFLTIKKDEETFWNDFKNKKLEAHTIQKIKDILELTEDETLEIFFDETIGQQQARKFYNLMLKIIRSLPDEERLVFLNTFDQKFSILKR